MIKLLYRPLALLLSTLAAAAAGKITKIVWAKFSGDDSAPTATDKHGRWGEIAAAAALEGAVFGGTRAVVDRAGAKALARVTGTWPGRTS